MGCKIIIFLNSNFFLLKKFKACSTYSFDFDLSPEIFFGLFKIIYFLDKFFLMLKSEEITILVDLNLF